MVKVKLYFDPDDPFSGQPAQPGPMVDLAIVPAPGMELPGPEGGFLVRRVRLRAQSDTQGIAADIIVTRMQ